MNNPVRRWRGFKPRHQRKLSSEVSNLATRGSLVLLYERSTNNSVRRWRGFKPRHQRKLSSEVSNLATRGSLKRSVPKTLKKKQGSEPKSTAPSGRLVRISPSYFWNFKSPHVVVTLPAAETFPRRWVVRKVVCLPSKETSSIW